MKKLLGVCIFACLHVLSVVALANEDSVEIVVDNRLTALEVAGVTELTGAGGVMLPSLAIPADARLVFDPIATPIKVSSTPAFGDGARIALSSDYAGVTLGRIVLMTYPGAAAVPSGLFDASCVSGSVSLSQEIAPDGTNRQLVLTVGDYANEAKEIRILPIGDSITHGRVRSINGYSQQAQYRTAIAARLAANGYRPVMLGHLKTDASVSAKTCDAAGVQQPDEWIWHSGVSGDRIISSATSTRGGVRDNLHLYLDVAGKPDVITLLIGTNDLDGSLEAVDAFVAYTNLVWEISRQRPNTKIVASTLLERTENTNGAAGKVASFNELLLANLANLPANYACTNLYPVVPQSIPGAYFDGLHPTMKGNAPISQGFAAKIMEVLPRATYAGPIEDTRTDEPQSALGAAATVPAAYRDGMTHVFTLDATGAANVFYGSAPYTATNTAVALGARLKRAGYYLELVRARTNRRRYVWVDFNALGKTLDEIDFPWTGKKFHAVVNNLHVFSNDSAIHNIPAGVFGRRGVVEATSANYGANDNQIPGVPADLMGGGKFGWNDTLNESGAGYGCFQVHRIFSQTSDDRHWNDAEVLFVWNRWGSDRGVDEIGIGVFANHANDNTMDYTYTSSDHEASFKNGIAETLSAEAYQVRHLEIWAEPFEVDEEKGEWISESAATSGYTGEWSDAVEYGADGRARLGGEVVFTPFEVSTGNVVTVETKAKFVAYSGASEPDATAQAAVRIGTNGCFQVWTMGNVANVEVLPMSDKQSKNGNTGNIPMWVDVEAEGVTPISGEEYTLRLTLDYTAGSYGVEVKAGLNGFTRLRKALTASFPLVARANCVTSVTFVGDTLFTSLLGACRYEVTGFQPGEITVADATVILDAAKTAWLNARGDFAAVKNRLANITSNEFETAWLCNLDLMNEDASAELKITGIDVNADNVEVAVTLTRTGAISQAINGILKFYGASTLAAFKDDSAAPIDSTTLMDDDFSEGDTATATFPKDANAFFNAVVEER